MQATNWWNRSRCLLLDMSSGTFAVDYSSGKEPNTNKLRDLDFPNPAGRWGAAIQKQNRFSDRRKIFHYITRKPPTKTFSQCEFPPI